MSCGCGCEGQGEYVWGGTGLKFAVSMTCEGFNMDEDDWTITVVRGNKSIEFNPSNAVHETVPTPEGDVSQWYICVETSELGPGEMSIIFDASVPDDDFESGVRHEIQKYKLVNIKSL